MRIKNRQPRCPLFFWLFLSMAVCMAGLLIAELFKWDAHSVQIMRDGFPFFVIATAYVVEDLLYQQRKIDSDWIQYIIMYLFTVRFDQFTTLNIALSIGLCVLFFYTQHLSKTGKRHGRKLLAAVSIISIAHMVLSRLLCLY